MFGYFTQYSFDVEHVSLVFIREETQILKVLSTRYFSLFKYQVFSSFLFKKRTKSVPELCSTSSCREVVSFLIGAF